VNTFFTGAFAQQVINTALFADEMNIGERIGNDAIYLFGHRPVETPQTRFDVCDLDMKFCRGQGAGECRIDVSGDNNQIGTFVEQDSFKGRHYSGGLFGMRGGADVEKDIGCRNS